MAGGYYPDPSVPFFEGAQLTPYDTVVRVEPVTNTYGLINGDDTENCAVGQGGAFDFYVSVSTIAPGVVLDKARWFITARGPGTLALASGFYEGYWDDTLPGDAQEYGPYTPLTSIEVTGTDWATYVVDADPACLDPASYDAGGHSLQVTATTGPVEIAGMYLQIETVDGLYVKSGDGRYSEWFPEVEFVPWQTSGTPRARRVSITGSVDMQLGVDRVRPPTTEELLLQIHGELDASVDALTGQTWDGIDGGTNTPGSYRIVSTPSTSGEAMLAGSQQMPTWSLPNATTYRYNLVDTKTTGALIEYDPAVVPLTTPPEFTTYVNTEGLIEGVHYSGGVDYEHRTPTFVQWEQRPAAQASLNFLGHANNTYKTEVSVTVKVLTDWDIGDPIPAPNLGSTVVSTTFAAVTSPPKVDFPLPAITSPKFVTFAHITGGYGRVEAGGYYVPRVIRPRWRYWQPEWVSVAAETANNGPLSLRLPNGTMRPIGTGRADYPTGALKLATPEGWVKERMPSDGAVPGRPLYAWDGTQWVHVADMVGP